MIGVRLQVVLIFSRRVLDFAIEMLNDSVGVSAEFVQERRDPINSRLLPGGAGFPCLFQLAGLAFQRIDVVFNLVNRHRVTFHRDVHPREAFHGDRVFLQFERYRLGL